MRKGSILYLSLLGGLLCLWATETRAQEKPITEISVMAPSTAVVGEELWVGIKMLTQPFKSRWIPQWRRTGVTVDGPYNESPRGTHYMENVLPTWKGKVTIKGGDAYEGPSEYDFSKGSGPYQNDRRPVRRLEGVRFSQAGTYFIEVTDPATGIAGISNPIRVTAAKPEARLYWGELHCHSFFGDGIRNPEELHSFARDEAFLDVFSLTDHTEALSDGQWTYFCAVSNTYNQSGRFVSLIGGEWTSKDYGHHNFLYPGDSGPILRCTDPEQDTLEKLFAVAKANGAIIAANHPAEADWGFEWDKGHDGEVERLVEVYSIGGSFEMQSGPGYEWKSRRVKKPNEGNFVVDGIKKGVRVGFIGVGDTHDGRPGDSMHALQEKPEGYSEILSPGLVGIWAKDLSRESVFEALWNRRVFATTKNRSYLEFSINGQPMGAEIQADKELLIQVKVVGDTPITKVELIQEGEVVQSKEPDSKDTKELTCEWKEAFDSDSTWYYVRVSMEQEHLAWSSPIWVEKRGK